MVLENFLRDVDILWDRVGKSLHERPDALVGRKMRVQVVNASIVEDLTGYALNLGWKSMSDETKFGLDGFTIIDATKGIFEIEYTSGMLSNYGSLRGTLQLVPPVGNTVESNNFGITVKKSAIDSEAIQSETSFTALTMALVSVQNLESTYAPELLSVKQQLAEIDLNKVDKNGSGQVGWANIAQDAREQIIGSTPPAVVGTNSVLTPSITDNAVTWAKRTKVGGFAKVLLTGDIPNFNTSTGILTFPSDIRILVGLSYYSVPAQTVDFSALLTTSSQILILFNVTTLAFQVVSPASLSSASHEQSVLVASIMNVTGRRKTPEMNCQFSVNNVPYIPDIERMLLSKAIPQTEQVVQYHVSGVINNIQHKDSNGNTIRTDTFTFSAGTVVEERRHNLTNTKITFTTTLSTLTTEVI